MEVTVLPQDNCRCQGRCKRGSGASSGDMSISSQRAWVSLFGARITLAFIALASVRHFFVIPGSAGKPHYRRYIHPVCQHIGSTV